jgi:hypothetical protein
MLKDQTWRGKKRKKQQKKKKSYLTHCTGNIGGACKQWCCDTADVVRKLKIRHRDAIGPKKTFSISQFKRLT